MKSNLKSNMNSKRNTAMKTKATTGTGTGTREKDGLLLIALAIAVALFFRSNEKRKEYVDAELKRHGEELNASRERAATRSGIVKAAAGGAVALGTLILAGAAIYSFVH
jgi:hypothetical protein